MLDAGEYRNTDKNAVPDSIRLEYVRYGILYGIAVPL